MAEEADEFSPGGLYESNPNVGGTMAELNINISLTDDGDADKVQEKVVAAVESTVENLNDELGGTAEVSWDVDYGDE